MASSISFHAPPITTPTPHPPIWIRPSLIMILFLLQTISISISMMLMLMIMLPLFPHLFLLSVSPFLPTTIQLSSSFSSSSAQPTTTTTTTTTIPINTLNHLLPFHPRPLTTTRIPTKPDSPASLQFLFSSITLSIRLRDNPLNLPLTNRRRRFHIPLNRRVSQRRTQRVLFGLFDPPNLFCPLLSSLILLRLPVDVGFRVP